MTSTLGYNNDFTDQDAQRLWHIASSIYSCGWVTGHNVPCNEPLLGDQFPEHLRNYHGIVGPDKTPVRCGWTGCYQEMKKESLMRHVQERHLELRYACPHCPEVFTRTYTRDQHVSRKHSGN